MYDFDEDYYLNNNPDVKQSMILTGWPQCGHQHFIKYGYKENRKVRWQDKRAKFIVFAYPFNFSVGGIVSLHKLCSTLREVGEDAWLWIDGKIDSNYYGLPIANDIIDPRKNIVIYPTVIAGNPLKSQHVVRWLMGTGKKFPTETWDNNDLIASFVPAFSRDYPDALPLWVIELWEDKFNSKNAPIRKGTCFTVRKGKNKKRIKEIEEFEIKDKYTIDSLAEIFRSKKIFYSYDIYTGLNLLAAMCGCISVVIPDENVTKEKWIADCMSSKYGVAYGLNDIEWAINTMPMITQHLKKMQEDSIKDVKSFAIAAKKSFAINNLLLPH